MPEAVSSRLGMAFFEVVKKEFGMKNRDVFQTMEKLTPDDWEDITRGFISAMMVGALGIKKTRKAYPQCFGGVQAMSWKVVTATTPRDQEYLFWFPRILLDNGNIKQWEMMKYGKLFEYDLRPPKLYLEVEDPPASMTADFMPKSRRPDY